MLQIMACTNRRRHRRSPARQIRAARFPVLRLTTLRQGFTITEILVAATLSLFFAALVAQVIATGIRSTGDTLARLEADTRSREVFRTVTASLRGAQPLGSCLDPQGVTNIDDCLLVGPAANANAVTVAKPDEIVFYAYSNATGDGFRTAPDRIRMYYCRPTGELPNGCSDTDRGLVKVSRLSAPAGSSYINPPTEWLSGAPVADTAAEQFRLGQLSLTDTPTAACGGGYQIFRYFNAQGVELVDLATCQVNLKDVALVLIDAKVTYKDSGSTTGTSVLTLSAAVSLRSSAYGLTEAVN